MLTNCSPKKEKSFHVLDDKVEIYPIFMRLSVSWDRHYKVPPTGRPRPTQIGCFTDPEAISLISRCWQSYVLSDSSRREFFLASSSYWCLLASSVLPGLWLHHSCSTAVFSMCVLTSSSLCAFLVSVSKFLFSYIGLEPSLMPSF